MDIKVFGLILIGFVGVVSCQQELYDEVFWETEPHLERYEVIGMLRDLDDFYARKNEVGKSWRIQKVLENSEVSEKKCKSTSFMYSPDSRIKGRAYVLLEESRKIQAKLCKDMWERDLHQSARRLSSTTLNAVKSMVKSMVDANGGRYFEGEYLQMAPDRAQEGILRYMAQKSGNKLSKRTKEDKFAKLFEEYVQEPCEDYTNGMPLMAEDYTSFLQYPDLNIRLDATAAELSNIDQICKYIIGYGYSTSPKRSFFEDTFKNLVQRK